MRFIEFAYRLGRNLSDLKEQVIWVYVDEYADADVEFSNPNDPLATEFDLASPVDGIFHSWCKVIGWPKEDGTYKYGDHLLICKGAIVSDFPWNRPVSPTDFSFDSTIKFVKK